MYKFELMIGTHSQKEEGPNNTTVLKTYKRGDKFVSKHNLAKLFNAGVMKFRPIRGNDDADESGVADAAYEGFSGGQETATAVAPAPVATKQGELDSMTVKQLKDLAAELEIDVTEANGKQELINTIQSAMDAR